MRADTPRMRKSRFPTHRSKQTERAPVSGPSHLICKEYTAVIKETIGAIALIVENIPKQLTERPQWVCWRLEERDDKETKVPYTPGTLRRASSTDLMTCGVPSRTHSPLMRLLSRLTAASGSCSQAVIRTQASTSTTAATQRQARSHHWHGGLSTVCRKATSKHHLPEPAYTSSSKASSVTAG